MSGAINYISGIFSYSFILRALIVGSLAALCSSLLGVSLVLKRYSMIGDGLSHVAFGTLAVAAAANAAPLKVSIPLVLVAAFLLLRMNESGKVKSDAAIALVSGSSLAIGVIVISVSAGMNTDLNSYMFGSILAVSNSDFYLSIVIGALVLLGYILLYNRIFALTFDEDFAKATGTNTELCNLLIAFMAALVIVIGMRIMGAMLISSLMVFPAVTSMQIVKNFRGVTICSGILAVLCFCGGLLVSAVFSLPTGASIVVFNLAAFCLFYILGSITKRTGNKL